LLKTANQPLHRRMQDLLHMLELDPLLLTQFLSPPELLRSHSLAFKMITSQSHQAELPLRQKYTVKLQKMMSGLLFRSSISYFTTKNKSKVCCVSKSAEDLSAKSLISKCKKKLSAKNRPRMKTVSITNFKRSMSNSWV